MDAGARGEVFNETPGLPLALDLQPPRSVGFPISREDTLMATPKRDIDTGRDSNQDPITGEPGAHPVGVGVGTAAGGAAAGALGGAAAGPVGAVVGAVAGGLAG